MISKNGKAIVSKIKFCNSIFSKATGLRFRRSPKDSVYVFTFDKPQKVLMDMWFVFYPIDVVFLDEKKRVVEIKKDFKPFCFYNSRKDAKYILEFENGVVEKNKIIIGDILGFD